MNLDKPMQSETVSIRWRPIAAFFACMFAIDLCFPFLISVALIGPRLLPFVVVGLILGQGCFVSVIAGLVGRSWLKGLTLATGLVAIGIGQSFVGQVISIRFRLPMRIYLGDGSEIACALFILPLPCLASSIAGLILRQVFGWRLTWSRRDFTPREPIRLIDFFLVMTTLACFFGMFRIPFVVWNIRLYDLVVGLMLAVSATFCLCNFLVAIPCTYFAFRSKRPLTGFLSSFGISLIVPVVLGLAIGLYSLYSGSGSFTNYIGVTLSTGAVAGLIISLGLLSLRRSGVRLLHYPSRSSPVPILEPEGIDCDAPAIPQSNSHLVWTLGVALFAMVSSLPTSYLVYWRDDTENRIGHLQQELSVSKSSISVKDWQVVGLKLGPNSSRETLDSFPYLAQIESLSIAHSNLSTQVVDSIDRFRKLQSLDLSHTDLDDSGLKRLTESSLWPKLQHLSVAGTKITPKSWQRFLPNSCALRSIDLSDLGLTEENLKSPLFQFESMKLAGNQISDSGLTSLLFNRTNYGSYRRLLNLSNNSIDGSGFTMTCTINRLVLDGNPLTDATFGPQLKNLHVYGSLVLRNTQLTDSFLATLAATTTIQGVELADGNFTEEGLKKNTLPRIMRLGLTGKQFTGSCFEDWKPAVIELSMRGSRLNDETMGFIAKLSSVRFLDLSKTAITDAGLASLKSMSILNKLNLSDTKITAKGLLASSIPIFCEIQLATGQFTSAEIKRLRVKWKVIVSDTNLAIGE